MNIFLLVFGGYLLGMGIGILLAKHWNKEIIDNQKEFIVCLVEENDILDKKLLEVCNCEKTVQKHIKKTVRSTIQPDNKKTRVLRKMRKN